MAYFRTFVRCKHKIDWYQISMQQKWFERKLGKAQTFRQQSSNPLIGKCKRHPKSVLKYICFLNTKSSIQSDFGNKFYVLTLVIMGISRRNIAKTHKNVKNFRFLLSFSGQLSLRPVTKDSTLQNSESILYNPIMSFLQLII